MCGIPDIIEVLSEHQLILPLTLWISELLNAMTFQTRLLKTNYFDLSYSNIHIADSMWLLET